MLNWLFLDIQVLFLFTLFLAALLPTVSDHLSAGVFIRTRSDGKLFKLARPTASATNRQLCIRELLFADAAAIVVHTLEDTREMCKQFVQAVTLFGLTINTKTTVTLYQRCMTSLLYTEYVTAGQNKPQQQLHFFRKVYVFNVDPTFLLRLYCSTNEPLITYCSIYYYMPRTTSVYGRPT